MSFLFQTRLRKKLLAYSFTHTDESYYVRELAALIGEDPGNLSRELRRLEDEGLYHSSLKGKEKFYTLNPRYPLFAELKRIVFKTEGVEGSLKTLISKYPGIRFAFIYGSYAKNTEKKTSDIDLVVVGQAPQNELTRQIRDLEKRLDREVNFTLYREEEFERERNNEGGFLNTVLKEKIIILKGEFND